MPNTNLLTQLQSGAGAGNVIPMNPSPGGTIAVVGGISASNGSNGAGLQVVTNPTTTTTIINPGAVLNPTGTTPGTTTTGGQATTPIIPTTSTKAPTGQEVAAAPVSPAKVWYQDWKIITLAAVVLAGSIFIYLKTRKK